MTDEQDSGELVSEEDFKWAEFLEARKSMILWLRHRGHTIHGGVEPMSFERIADKLSCAASQVEMIYSLAIDARERAIENPDEAEVKPYPGIWQEPSEAERERLYWLAEELVESLVEAHKLTIKTLRFGAEEVYPETLTTNRARLEAELGDIFGVIQTMCEYGDLDRKALTEQCDRKALKLKIWARASGNKEKS